MANWASTATRTAPRPLVLHEDARGRSADRLKRVGSHHAVLAPLLYLAISLVMWRQVVAHLDSACLCNATADPTQFMWALVWWPHAILHGINPLVSHAIWVPNGVDLARVTAMPAASLAAAPLTAISGPLVSYNVLSILAPVLSAWAAYRLCLYVTRSPAASIFGGYLFGFSSYELAALIGHLHLVFTFVIPLLALMTLKRLDGLIGVRRYVVLSALLLCLQLLLSTEILLTMTCMGAVTLAFGWLCASRARRSRIVSLLPPLAGAYVLMAIVCSPFLYYALFRGSAVSLGWGARFPGDALGFVIPTAITRVGGHRFLAVSGTFIGNLVEDGTYLGLPIVIIVAAFTVQRWRTSAAKVLACSLAVAVVWTLGAHLWISGHPTISLPWAAFQGLPLLDELLPVRIGVYVALLCAVIVALWVSAPARSAWRRWALAGLAVVFVLPNTGAAIPGTSTPLYHATISQPAFFTGDLYRGYLRRGETVLPIPYAWTGLSLLWQADTQMYFAMASGYFGWPAPGSYAGEPIVPQLVGNAPGPDAPVQLRSFLLRRHVSDVVIDASQAGPWPGVLARMGLRGQSVGGVLLYHVH